MHTWWCTGDLHINTALKYVFTQKGNIIQQYDLFGFPSGQDDARL